MGESPDWRERLKHLDLESSGADSSGSEQHFAHSARHTDEFEPRTPLPEGVSFSRSRGIKGNSPRVGEGAGAVANIMGLFGAAKDASAKSAGNGHTSKTNGTQGSNSDFESDPRPGFRGPDCSIEDMLSRVSVEKLVDDYYRKKRLIWAGVAVGLLGAVVAFTSFFFPSWGEFGYWVRRIFLLPLPVCLAIVLNEICKKLSVSHPILARRVFGFLTFGNAGAKCDLALLDIDLGDYARAEKTLAGAVKSIQRKKRPRDYITTYAFLASVRANVGKLVDAERQVVRLLSMAKAHYDARPNDANATMLATTLVYAARVSDLRDKPDEALRLYGSAVELLCNQGSPPADLLVSTLASTGSQCNLSGLHDQAALFLETALEISEKMPDARESTRALIYTNLGICVMSMGDFDAAVVYLDEAEKLAKRKISVKELPNVLQAWAILAQVMDQSEVALDAYGRAVRALEKQSPSESLQLARLLVEYSDYLRNIGQTELGNEQFNRARQIKYSLDQANSTSGADLKDDLKPVDVPVLKARFPIFWMILVGLAGWGLLEQGLRIAPFTAWILPTTAVTVLIIKLMAKYGKHSEQDNSQGTILAIASAVPFARHVVPELAVIPVKRVSIVLGLAVAVLLGVKITSPAPGVVPDSGLLAVEYCALAEKMARTERFSEAEKAIRLASKPDLSGDFAAQLEGLKKLSLPKSTHPDPVYEENLRALGLTKGIGVNSGSAEARKIWTEMTKSHPDFEIPYFHLAELSVNEDINEAERLAKKGLEINPEFASGHLTLYRVYIEKKDPDRANEELQKALGMVVAMNAVEP